MELAKLERARLLPLRAGDTLIVNVPAPLTEAVARDIRDELVPLLPAGVRVVVAEFGAEFIVARPADRA